MDELAALLLPRLDTSDSPDAAREHRLPPARLATATAPCMSTGDTASLPSEALRRNPAASALLATTLLRSVAPLWLPRLDGRYTHTVDALFGALPADSAAEAACSACADDEDGVAAAAQRLLFTRFLAPGSPGLRQLAATWPGGDADQLRLRARHELLVTLLVALPDKAARLHVRGAPHATQPIAAQVLSHDRFFDALARAAADAVASGDGGSAASDGTADQARALGFAVLVWARLARRGGVAAVAGALVAVHGSVGPALLQAVAEDEMSTATRVVDALLRHLGAMASLTHEERVRITVTLLLPSMAKCPLLASAFAHTLPLRQPPWCRNTMAVWLQVVLLDPTVAAALPKLRGEALRCLSRTWADPAMIASPGGAATAAMHAYLTGVLVAALRVPGRALWFATLCAAEPGLGQTLLGGIGARLGAPLPNVRLGGMRVAAALADAMNADAEESQRRGGGAADASRPLPRLFTAEAAAPSAPGDIWGGDVWADALQGARDQPADQPSPPAPPPSQPSSGGDAAPASKAAAEVAVQAVDSDDESVDELGSLSPFDMSDTEDVSPDACGDGALRDDAPVPSAPVPTSLKGLLDALRDGATTVAGGVVTARAGPGKPTATAVAEAALCGAEELIRSGAPELPMFASALALALLRAPPAWADSDADADADGQPGTRPRVSVRTRAMVALLEACPVPAAQALSTHFTAAQLDAGTRLEILDVLCLAAEELASVRVTPGPATPDAGGSTAVMASPPRDAAVPARRQPPATRIKAPVSLAVRARGPRRGGVNRFGAAADAFAAPLLQAAAAALGVDNVRPTPSASGWDDMSPLAWLRSAQTPGPGSGTAADATPDDDAISSLILGRLLITLGVLCACAANTVVATTLPAAVLALLSTSPGTSRRIPALHSQPYVRRGAHYASGQALLALPPASVAAALEEGGGPLMDAIDAVWCVSRLCHHGSDPTHAHARLPLPHQRGGARRAGKRAGRGEQHACVCSAGRPPRPRRKSRPRPGRTAGAGTGGAGPHVGACATAAGRATGAHVRQLQALVLVFGQHVRSSADAAAVVMASLGSLSPNGRAEMASSYGRCGCRHVRTSASSAGSAVHARWWHGSWQQLRMNCAAS